MIYVKAFASDLSKVGKVTGGHQNKMAVLIYFIKSWGISYKYKSKKLK